MVKNEETSLLFTTHRLDEAEFLCDKIGIIMGGKLICFGTQEELKNKYGNSYFILLTNPQVSQVEKFINKKFNNEKFERISENVNIDSGNK